MGRMVDVPAQTIQGTAMNFSRYKNPSLPAPPTGKVTKAVPKLHQCIRPQANEMAKSYGPGTIWTCDCGKESILIKFNNCGTMYSYKDVYVWNVYKTPSE
jgi:hypothetical protein